MKDDRPIENKEDIIYIVSEECNVPRKQVEYIIDNFWLTVRGFITNPLTTKAGILLHGFANFFIKPKSVQSMIQMLERKERNNEKFKTRSRADYSLTFYKTLLKNIDTDGKYSQGQEQEEVDSK